MTHKNREKLRNFMFHVSCFKCWMFSLRAEGFSYCLDILDGGLRISKLQLLMQKMEKCFPL
jgi:hypothetical protein